MHGTRSTSSSSFSSVPGLQRLITYGKPFADSRELHGVTVRLNHNPTQKEMLVRRLPPTLNLVVHVVSDDEAFRRNLAVLLVICTNGCFFSAPCVRHVLKADADGAHFVHVVAEHQFHFSTDTFIDDLRSRARHLFQWETHHNVEVLGRTVRAMFSEIAVTVDLQDSAEVLDVPVGALARRLATLDDSCVERRDVTQVAAVRRFQRQAVDEAQSVATSRSSSSSRSSSRDTQHTTDWM